MVFDADTRLLYSQQKEPVASIEASRHRSPRRRKRLDQEGQEITEMLEAYDLTRCAFSAAELSGADRKTVRRYGGICDAGHDPLEHARHARLIDLYMEKVEELVDDSKAKVRADVAHDRLRAIGYDGTERTSSSPSGSSGAQ
jgi:hypothetical protein